MGTTVTPSEAMTTGQIGKICDLLTAALRKAGLQNGPVQQIIETQGEALTAELVGALRKRIEAVSDMIVRHVRDVDRARAPRQALEATGRNLYVNDRVVEAMPRGQGTEADIYFFKLGRYVSDTDLDKEYALRGLVPADPYSLAAVNEDDPAFADDYSNATHWKDVNGRWCHAAFGRWDGERGVLVDSSAYDWDVDWWFAGIRK
jgi:hypothetical protein